MRATTKGFSSITLEGSGASLYAINVLIIPRDVYRRKLILIRLQGQSKIRQCWCCLHDSTTKNRMQLKLAAMGYNKGA
ncbi:endosomal targeting BRO1-like domain-containing protein [Actinidia rufa]|uniref:Endosomal targeting BRO1-like domain-containing protein n=1 Tax=Actinidia rufa TaxID=165716 RepID=A0A7J0DJ50_9ERIC|nr:endosomal targeting BRO1-like domain-containing protein [Actinidia rufa]